MGETGAKNSNLVYGDSVRNECGLRHHKKQGAAGTYLSRTDTVDFTLLTRLDDGPAPYDAVHFICAPAHTVGLLHPQVRAATLGSARSGFLSTEGVLTGTPRGQY